MANAGRKGIICYTDDLSAVSVGSASIGIDSGTISQAALYGARWTQSLDTGDTSWARAVSATKGMHLSGSLGATDNNFMELCGNQLMFYGQTGFNAVEVMFQVDASSALAFNFGFHDEVTESSNTLPVQLSTSTLVASASTFLGFVYDADATNDELHVFWTDDDVDTTVALGDLRCRGMALTVDKWLWMRVEMQDQGSGKPVRGTFHAAHDGKTITKEFTTSVDRDQALCWYLGVENRDALARGIYVKAPGYEQSIAD